MLSAVSTVPARPRVLVVKDDGGAGRAYLGPIRAKGFDVELVAHGEPAVAAVLSRRHEGILVEQCAFADHGWTLLHLIRVYLARRDVPILILARTGDDASAEQRWRAYDVARVFEKSAVSGAAVRDCLCGLLDPSRPQKRGASLQEAYIVPAAASSGSGGLRFTLATAASPGPNAPAATP